MSTSRIFGAVCATAFLLTAGCATSEKNLPVNARDEAVTAAQQEQLSVFGERVGPAATITFDFDRDALDAQAMSLLDAQAVWMAKRPEVTFTVTGHGDMTGDRAYNLDLGLRRAERVVNYLVAIGIDYDRLEAQVSQGEADPLVKTDGPEPVKRRVVIKALLADDTDAALETRPWWQHKRQPHPPNFKDGTSPQHRTDGGPLASSSRPSRSSEGPTTPVDSPLSTSSRSDSPASGGQGAEPGSTTGSSNDQGSSGTKKNKGKNGSKGSGKGKGKGKGKGSTGKGGTTTKSNPSDDRVDAGRGNGSETGGDPGESEEVNKGGDEQD